MITKKPLLLIVDDIPSNVQTLAAILKNDYEIKVATNGQRALELSFSNIQPDLILLDVEMPQMNGYEVCMKLKNTDSTKNIPIIFITANHDIEDEEKGLNLGAVDYITKPVNPAIVRARVKTHITIKKQYDELKFIAMHDKLTSLYNRHYLMDAAIRKISSATRKNEPLTIVMSDIDHFKMVNDTYGHLVGDGVLKDVASVLNSTNRAEDFVARYGGEEFVTIFENCDAQNAAIKAQQMREEIENLNSQGIKITSSFGVAQLSAKHENFDMLLKDADDALYLAKSSGRNKVVIYKN